jgi:hypothetical protein
MIETYGIRPNPVEIGQGFEAIPDGLKKLRVSLYSTHLADQLEQTGLGKEACLQAMTTFRRVCNPSTVYRSSPPCPIIQWIRCV